MNPETLHYTTLTILTILTNEEEYQTDQQYEQERFTDEYSEYFEDDENKADRLTDDYQEDLKD